MGKLAEEEKGWAGFTAQRDVSERERERKRETDESGQEESEEQTDDVRAFEV